MLISQDMLALYCAIVKENYRVVGELKRKFGYAEITLRLPGRDNYLWTISFKHE